MKKAAKKLLSITLCLLMLLGTVAIGGGGLADLLETVSVKASAATITEYNNGDVIEFGSYPQSKVTDSSLIKNLNSLAGNNKKWTSYGYYTGTGDYNDGKMKTSDYMRYKDVTYDSIKYRGVIFDSYRPSYTGDTSSADDSNQDDNGYTTGTTYWFRYEPIEWRVLDSTSGLIICNMVIDSQAHNNYGYYDGVVLYGDSECSYYASNYEKSSIRKWLNSDFYNDAFSKDQQDIINITTLSNNAYDKAFSAFDSNSTFDKIFLLSYDDVNNNKYFNMEELKSVYGTDYAKCQGLEVVGRTDSNNVINEWNISRWFLRSPGASGAPTCVDYDGEVIESFRPSNTSTGIRPALNLNLTSDIIQSDASEISEPETMQQDDKESDDEKEKENSGNVAIIIIAVLAVIVVALIVVIIILVARKKKNPSVPTNPTYPNNQGNPYYQQNPNNQNNPNNPNGPTNPPYDF